jgi:O-methyltransferase
VVLLRGTILMFDEFGDVQHEFRAVHYYLSSYRLEVSVLYSRDDCFAIAVELQ